jgi:transposase InsO family protein
VADLTYVSTWSGWIYVAFVIDAFARRILARAQSEPADRHARSEVPAAGHAAELGYPSHISPGYLAKIRTNGTNGIT